MNLSSAALTRMEGAEGEGKGHLAAAQPIRVGQQGAARARAGAGSVWGPFTVNASGF